jgi:hypothetical protein
MYQYYAKNTKHSLSSNDTQQGISCLGSSPQGSSRANLSEQCQSHQLIFEALLSIQHLENMARSTKKNYPILCYAHWKKVARTETEARY